VFALTLILCSKVLLDSILGLKNERRKTFHSRSSSRGCNQMINLEKYASFTFFRTHPIEDCKKKEMGRKEISEDEIGVRAHSHIGGKKNKMKKVGTE